MKYILLIYGPEQVWSSLTKAEMEEIYAGHRVYQEAMEKDGILHGSSELKPVSMATSVKFSRGVKPRTLDGPFAETKEQLAGYYVIDVANLEEALGWAEKMPGMIDGTVEVRPLASGD